VRILLTHVYAWPEVRRGGERYLHELSAALQDAGHQVTVVSTAPEPGRALVLGVEVIYLPRRPWLRRYQDLSTEACFGLEVLGRRALSRIDVWHALGTADGATASWLGRWRPGVRSVYTDLGNPVRAWRESRPDAALHARIVRDVDEYVCLSSFAEQMLTRDYQRTGRVVGGGVDTSRFVPSAARTQTPTLLYSGSLTDSRKNLPLLLEAVAVLRGRRDVRLVVSGPGDVGPVLAAAPEAARACTEVAGLGDAAELGRLYGEAWATVLPSEHEAFGLVLVESLACGTPIVALRDGGGPAELVTPGVGALADRSADGLADACDTALDLAAAGAATVDACRSAASAHDWRTSVVPRLEAVYRGGLPGRS
jgi:glycosyltransferase involved in cell wall biosynthesis